MPTPLPKDWKYGDCFDNTLYIWNGSSNEIIAHFQINYRAEPEIKFTLALPEDVKKTIVDRVLRYHEEVEEEKQKKRKEEIQNVIKSVRNSELADETVES